MPWSHDGYKIRKCNMNIHKMSSENLDHLNKIIPRNYDPARVPYNSRPITFSRYPNKLRRNSLPQSSNFGAIKQSQAKGLIFVWPQRKTFRNQSEYSVFIRVLAHVLYWLGVIGILPSGSGMPVKKPPWKIEAPIPKPENRDYIIEPDWNSVFK